MAWLKLSQRKELRDEQLVGTEAEFPRRMPEVGQVGGLSRENQSWPVFTPWNSRCGNQGQMGMGVGTFVWIPRAGIKQFLKGYISRYCTLIWLSGEGRCLKLICVLPTLNPADSHCKLEILACASPGLVWGLKETEWVWLGVWTNYRSSGNVSKICFLLPDKQRWTGSYIETSDVKCALKRCAEGAGELTDGSLG